ncbi:hypothetical protein QIW31_08615 [Francisellaceae bacterium CB299]|jgi:hypothetical protein
MKKKVIGMAMLTGVVALSGCVKERYKYLSTNTISILFTNAPATSGSGSLNNVHYSWDATSKILTLNCLSGYGYVIGTVNKAFNDRNEDLVAINTNGNDFDATDINLYPGNAAPVVTTDPIKNAYFIDEEDSVDAGVDLTCVPLSTDDQWAGN